VPGEGAAGDDDAAFLPNRGPQAQAPFDGVVISTTNGSSMSTRNREMSCATALS
jgi:hypothetical protein